jgi:glutamyl-tRNA synthetase
VFAHLPLILGPDRQRLSKRHGATSVGAYREQGILPEAIINFLALLGWTPPGGEEILSREVMTQQFELTSVSKSNAVFDPEKLGWMNSQYLRGLNMERLRPLVEAELKSVGLESTIAASPSKIEETVALLQPRMRTLKDFSQGGRAFFSDDFEYAPEAQKKFWKDPSLHALLQELAERLENFNSFDAQTTEQALRRLAEEKGVKAGLLINGTRVALTGQAVAPSLFDVMSVLGQERTVERLRRAAKFLRESNAGNT